jgi:AraC-like DNA-binding protein
MSEFLLPVLYLRQFAEQLRAMGKAPEDWLNPCGLALAQLDEPGFQPSFALFGQLVERAQALSAEPALGLLIGERLVVSSHGILGFAALQSGSLRQALEVLERYLALRTTLVSLRHVRDEAAQQEHIQLVARYPLGAIERTILEAVTLAIKNLLDAATLGSVRPARIGFAFAEPGYAKLAREMFDCPLAYAQPWTGFSFASAALDLPLRMADPEAFREAELICQRELRKLDDNGSLSARVRRLMLEKQHGFPSLTVTARLLHMTPRTLHRHLLAEGSSFKQLLEEVRHGLALQHLRGGRLTVEEIAYSLGYTDLANFRRAFRRWEGMAPSVYRERLSAG